MTASSSHNPEPRIPDGPLTCPKCGRGHIIEGRRGYGCDRYREGCDFVIWKEVAGKQLTEADVRCLVAHGRTGLIQGFTGVGRERLDARLKLDAEWTVIFDFAD